MTLPVGTQRPRCEFEGCGRVAEWGGLCPAHAMQRRRGSELRPIRERGIPMVQIGNISVPFDVAQALMAKGPTLYLAAKEVLTEWAASQAEPPAPSKRKGSTGPRKR